MKQPAVLIYDREAPEDKRAIHWNPGDIPDSVGIEDVARLVVRYRVFIRRLRRDRNRHVGTLSAISDLGLGRLLLCAYRASFLTDEGRPIRARLAVGRELPPANGDHPPDAPEAEKLHSCRLCPPVALDDPKVVAKLAPLLPERDGALTVRECGADLVVTGLTRTDTEDRDRQLLDLPGLWEPDAGLLIEILGPGHLRVREGRAGFTLFADRLLALGSLAEVEPVRKWLCDVSDRVVPAFKADPDYAPESRLFAAFDAGAEQTPRQPQHNLAVALGRVLKAAAALGHGGAFAVVPDPGSPFLDVKYRVDPVDLTAELADVWRWHCRLWAATKAGADQLLAAAEGKRVSVHRWLDRLDSVGRLSAADGCVVLDRGMKVHGFGAVVDADLDRMSPRRCVELPGERETTTDELLRLYGTRHKSAYALCHKVPHAVVVVVSQDGEMRVFASDETAVYFARGLRP
jgi:hypothetical protein